MSKVVHRCIQDKKKKYKAEDVAEFFHELLMYVCMFNLTFLVTCMAIFYSWGTLTDVASEVLIGFGIAITVGTFIYFLINPVDFYRFRLSFNATCITFNHYFFHATCIVLSVLLVSLPTGAAWAPFIPQGLMLLYTLVMKPYQFVSENLRSAFNYLVMCAITSMGFYYSLSSEIEREFSNFIYPAAIQGALFLAIVWAYVVVIKDFLLKWKLIKDKKRNLVFSYFDEQETIRKVEQIVLNSAMYQPKDAKEFVINEILTPTAMEKKKKEMKRKERELEFCESVKLKPEEKDILVQLDRKDLPDKKEALQIFHNELDFIRYQKAVQDSEKKFSKGSVDSEILEIFDAI